MLGFFKSTVWLFRGLLRGDQRGNVPPGHRPRHAEQYFQGQLRGRDGTRLLRMVGVCSQGGIAAGVNPCHCAELLLLTGGPSAPNVRSELNVCSSECQFPFRNCSTGDSHRSLGSVCCLLCRNVLSWPVPGAEGKFRGHCLGGSCPEKPPDCISGVIRPSAPRECSILQSSG